MSNCDINLRNVVFVVRDVFSCYNHHVSRERGTVNNDCNHRKSGIVMRYNFRIKCRLRYVRSEPSCSIALWNDPRQLACGPAHSGMNFSTCKLCSVFFPSCGNVLRCEVRGRAQKTKDPKRTGQELLTSSSEQPKNCKIKDLYEAKEKTREANTSRSGPQNHYSRIVNHFFQCSVCAYCYLRSTKVFYR